jgi:hypothetical protein
VPSLDEHTRDSTPDEAGGPSEQHSHGMSNVSVRLVYGVTAVSVSACAVREPAAVAIARRTVSSVCAGWRS